MADCVFCGNKTNNVGVFYPDDCFKFNRPAYVYPCCLDCRTNENLEKLEDGILKSEADNDKQNA